MSWIREGDIQRSVQQAYRDSEVVRKRITVVLSDEDRDLLRQIRDRLPAPASEYDYQAVTIQDQAGGLHQYPVRLTEDDRDYTHP